MSAKWLLMVLCFVMPTALLIQECTVFADSASPEEMAHMKAGHQKVEGVVHEVKSGLYTVKTSTATTYALAESTLIRYGRDLPKVGDEMVLWIDEGNLVIDARKKGAPRMTSHFASGKLVSVDYERSQVVLATSTGEKSFQLKPESRMFTHYDAGTPVTIEINEAGEVIDLHADKALSAQPKDSQRSRDAK